MLPEERNSSQRGGRESEPMSYFCKFHFSGDGGSGKNDHKFRFLGNNFVSGPLTAKNLCCTCTLNSSY